MSAMELNKRWMDVPIGATKKIAGSAKMVSGDEIAGQDNMLQPQANIQKYRSAHIYVEEIVHIRRYTLLN